MISSESFVLLQTLLPQETLATIYMVFASAFFAFLIGLPLGIALFLTERGSLYRTLGTIVNIGRSIPFAILMIVLIPFTRLIVGTSLGTTAAIVPLSIAAAPFFARLVESALKEIDHSLIEAALLMGAQKHHIVSKVLLPEALPSLIRAVTTTVVTLVGYSAMAGLVGGGGLGKVAIQYGYQRFDTFLMVTTLIILVALVEIIQWGGNALASRIEYQRGPGRL